MVVSRLEKGVGDATGPSFRRLRVGFAGRPRGQHRDQLFEEALSLPEDAERLVKQQAVLMLLDEDSVQRGVKVLPIPDARRLDRRERIEHRARTQRDARLAQGAGEMDDVLRQDAAACRFGFENRAHFAWLDLNSGGPKRGSQAPRSKT